MADTLSVSMTPASIGLARAAGAGVAPAAAPPAAGVAPTGAPSFGAVLGGSLAAAPPPSVATEAPAGEPTTIHAVVAGLTGILPGVCGGTADDATPAGKPAYPGAEPVEAGPEPAEDGADVVDDLGDAGSDAVSPVMLMAAQVHSIQVVAAGAVAQAAQAEPTSTITDRDAERRPEPVAPRQFDITEDRPLDPRSASMPAGPTVSSEVRQASGERNPVATPSRATAHRHARALPEAPRSIEAAVASSTDVDPEGVASVGGMSAPVLSNRGGAAAPAIESAMASIATAPPSRVASALAALRRAGVERVIVDGAADVRPATNPVAAPRSVMERTEGTIGQPLADGRVTTDVIDGAGSDPAQPATPLTTTASPVARAWTRRDTDTLDAIRSLAPRGQSARGGQGRVAGQPAAARFTTQRPVSTRGIGVPLEGGDEPRVGVTARPGADVMQTPGAAATAVEGSRTAGVMVASSVHAAISPLVGPAVSGATAADVPGFGGVTGPTQPRTLAGAQAAQGAATGATGSSSSGTVDQVASALAISVREGRTEATLSLRPAALGEVKVQITTGTDGLVIRLSAERESVGELLRTRVDDLRQALAGHQVAVSELHVLPNPPPVAQASPGAGAWQERGWSRREREADPDSQSQQRQTEADEDEAEG